MSVRRECCNYCMWLGPVNQDDTVRKHRPATSEDRYGRKVQNRHEDYCQGSHKPYARFGCETSAPTDDIPQENPAMTEYGVFNDEGCIYVADTRDEADAEAAKERAADDGYYADLISVHEMCPDHRDEEQPKDGCEECNAEDEYAEDE
jgi:hypothetical protein